MQLSTRGRYAIMALLDLAELHNQRQGETPVKLSEIAERQSISLSYLEQLFAKLRRHDIVASSRGPGGGYTLGRSPAEIWISDIINAVEEDIKVARCKDGEGGCMNGERCNAHDLWRALSLHIEAFMTKANLAMVMSGEICDFVATPDNMRNSSNASQINKPTEDIKYKAQIV